MVLVLVLYKYEYKAKDGHFVSIEPNESYILVSKTNEHWWHVRKDQHTRPFYVPAQYVTELPSPSENKTGPIMLDSPHSVADSKPVGVANKTQMTNPVSAKSGSSETYQFSTFGHGNNVADVKPCESTSNLPHIMDTTHHQPEGSTFHSEPPTADVFQTYAQPHVSKARKRKEPKSLPQDDIIEPPPPFLCDEDPDWPLPPSSNFYDTIPELNISDFDTFPDPPEPVEIPASFEQQNSNQGTKATSPSAVLPIEQVRFLRHNHDIVSLIINLLVIKKPGEGAGLLCKKKGSSLDLMKLFGHRSTHSWALLMCTLSQL